MSYRRRASPLHAARASVAICWCAALAVAALLCSSPLVLAAVLASVLIGGVGAGVCRPLLAALKLALPLALTVAVINALVTRDGLTVIWRFGDLPVFGQTDVTLEATVYGLILGMRAAALVLAGVLYSLCVDPDEVLRLLRRSSFHSALTASIATRMLPVLMRDSRRLAEAQRCRPGRHPSRLQLLRATTSGVLERALDVAAVLEVRGYACARRPVRQLRRPWSRHDLAFLASALGVLAVAALARWGALAPFQAYPWLRIAAGPAAFGCGAALAAVALLPFLDRRAVEP